MTVRLLSLVLLLASCDQSTGVCTLIGCNSGLTINVPAAAPIPYIISLQAPGAPELTLECTTSLCAHSVFVPDYTPAHVTVTVQWQGGGSATKDVSPAYTISQPNGPNCSPTCTACP